MLTASLALLEITKIAAGWNAWPSYPQLGLTLVVFGGGVLAVLLTSFKKNASSNSHVAECVLVEA